MHARSLESFEVLNRHPPISGPRGDYDRAGADALTIGQCQDKAAMFWIIRTLKPDHLVGDRHLGAKLLSLIVCARHQRHSGDPRRKAQVVLDPGRGAGLAAECAAVE